MDTRRCQGEQTPHLLCDGMPDHCAVARGSQYQVGRNAGIDARGAQTNAEALQVEDDGDHRALSMDPVSADEVSIIVSHEPLRDAVAALLPPLAPVPNLLYELAAIAERLGAVAAPEALSHPSYCELSVAIEITAERLETTLRELALALQSERDQRQGRRGGITSTFW
jgi:hypothetical protein